MSWEGVVSYERGTACVALHGHVLGRVPTHTTPPGRVPTHTAPLRHGGAVVRGGGQWCRCCGPTLLRVHTTPLRRVVVRGVCAVLV